MTTFVIFMVGIVIGHLFAPLLSALARLTLRFLGLAFWHGSIWFVALVVFSWHLIGLTAIVSYVWLRKRIG